MKVQELCSQNPAVCSPETTLAHAGWLMWENDCGILPVVADGKATTVITDRDIAIAAATKPRPASQIAVREVVNGKLFTCRPQDDVRDALKTMQKQRVRRLPVIDAEGRVTGVLSINDIVRAAKSARAAKPGEVTNDDVLPTLQSICTPWEGVEKAESIISMAGRG